MTSYRSSRAPGRDGFAQVLRAEWTKFRTVPGWVVGMFAAAVAVGLFGVLTAMGTTVSCGDQACPKDNPAGPGGEAVTDAFYFVHRSLDGDGSITAPLTSFTGETDQNSGPAQVGAAETYAPAALQPWAKAGLMVKQSTKEGAAYAAIMLTGAHGVRMQYDFTHDRGGTLAAARWLRLTRQGSTLTGYESTDGTHWTEVGSAKLPRLTTTVQAGMFVASPLTSTITSQGLSGGTGTVNPTKATAVFGAVTLQGSWSPGTWSGVQVAGQRVGGYPGAQRAGGFTPSGAGYSVNGSGDIVPASTGRGGGVGGGNTIEDLLSGTFAGLIVFAIVGAMFVTAEYRRGLIRTTLTASPRRGRVLVAKAIVLAAVTFGVSLLSMAVTIPLAEHILSGNGGFILATPTLTMVRVVVGTAALLALASVLAMTLGAVLRRGAGAIAAVVVLLVLPYLIGQLPVLPASLAVWLLRLTPAAGFAIQQSIPSYHQIAASFTPADGYYPLPPWIGFGVLCLWAGLALALAVRLLNRRDA